MPVRLRLALAAATLIGALAGCQTTADVRSCPRTSILGIAGDVPIYRAGGGDDVTDLAFQVEISGVTVECRPSKDKIDTSLSIVIAADRGPAGTGSPWVAYFVAVVERGTEKVLDKQIYRGLIPFETDQRRSVVVEEWEQTLKLPKGKLGKDYEIIVGLNLSPEELDAARRRRSE